MGNFLTRETPLDAPADHLLQLFNSIAEKTRHLTNNLHTRGLISPSFETEGAPDFPLAKSNDEGVKIREQLIEQTKELHDLLVGPREGMKAFSMEIFGHISIQAICDFRVAECVPINDSISYKDLAKEVEQRTGNKVEVPVLRKLVRLAISNNMFRESEWEYVGHNRSSLLLLEDETLSSWMSWFSADMFLICANAVPAMKRWPTCQEPSETGVNIAFGHKKWWFDHVQAEPERAKRFETMLHAHGSRDGYEVSHTVRSYPWDDLGQATVVDVGGLDGAVSMAIAEKYPSLSFIVQDLPNIRKESPDDGVPEHLRDRVSLTAHDCLTSQPVVADMYFFRFVFHSFSDKYAVKALQALIPALRPGIRVVIHDLVLPAPGTLPRPVEKSVRTMDVMVQTVCNASEREMEDWRRLFKLADERFKWKEPRKSSGKLWFMEAVWEG